MVRWNAGSEHVTTGAANLKFRRACFTDIRKVAVGNERGQLAELRFDPQSSISFRGPSDFDTRSLNDCVPTDRIIEWSD